MTDGKVAQKMNTFVIDKDELVRLRNDILENPTKYERLLTLKK